MGLEWASAFPKVASALTAGHVPRESGVLDNGHRGGRCEEIDGDGRPGAEEPDFDVPGRRELAFRRQ